MPRRRGLLHLTLGQDAIYFLLGVFFLMSLGLLIRYMNKHPTWDEYNKVKREKEELGRKYAELLKRTGMSDDEVKKFTKPPIIVLSDSAEFRFRSGSSEMSEAFRAALDEQVVPQIVKEAKEHGLNLIEVVGHTDEVPLGGKGSSLDFGLIPWLRNGTGPRLVPADNVGLGMARAAAVAGYLWGNESFRDLHIVALSAGQTILQEGTVSAGQPGRDANRRRIEIRFRKLGE